MKKIETFYKIKNNEFNKFSGLEFGYGDPSVVWKDSEKEKEHSEYEKYEHALIIRKMCFSSCADVSIIKIERTIEEKILETTKV